MFQKNEIDPMALILSIETSTTVCSVALHREGQLLCIFELHEENAHAGKLMLLIEDLFKRSGFGPKDLQAVAVSAGPGSYTGLRIGVSLAKGFSYAQNIPLIGVDALEALAVRALPFCSPKDVVIPMLDARRMEIYTSVISGDGSVIEPSHPLVVEDNPFENYLSKGKVFFLGDGLPKLKHVLGHSQAVFLSIFNSAISVGELAFEKFKKGQFEDVAYFEPNYLKDFRVIPSKKNPLLL